MILKTFQDACSKHKPIHQPIHQLVLKGLQKGFLVMALLLPAYLAHANDAFSYRSEQFKANKQAMRDIAQALSYDDFEAISDATSRIEDWGREMAQYFPKGSNPPPSQALDAIWEQPDAFAAAIDRHLKAVERLQTLVLDEDSAGLPQAMRDLAASCQACHQSFRY